MIDAIGWFGTAVMFWGAIDVAHKYIRGLWLMLIGNIAWLTVGWSLGLWPLVACSVVHGILDIYGIYQWRADENIEAHFYNIEYKEDR